MRTNFRSMSRLSFMKNPLPIFKCLPRRSALGILAVLVFFMVGMADVRSHFCLDGQEPAFTVHIENLDGHPEHSEEDADHNDLESEISLQTLKAKSTDLSKAWPVVLVTGIPPVNSQVQKISSRLDGFLLPQQPANLLPPLRAPPLLIG